MVSLRHDIDYSIDIALEMAFHEWRNGARATYYLLETAPYWGEPDFIEKCLQLEEFGHEVGLHINSVAKWVSGRTDDTEADLAAALAKLREGGVTILGIAAHGDPDCYRHQAINYWMFADLRPADPMATEDGLTAEGIPPGCEDRSIRYPHSDLLTRKDGAVLPLWQTRFADHGLRYHATHLNYDGYFSDSGGSWRRSADPLNIDLSCGRHQVLYHPIHWRGPQKKHFFLSTARSGSKWLATFLDKATSCRGQHEFTFNHRLDGDEPHHQNVTFTDFQALQADAEAMKARLHDALVLIEAHQADWAEANVYLVHATQHLRSFFPKASFHHLHRNPEQVVRSLINRDWYDTPRDMIHPFIDFAAHAAKDQIGRVCAYVREVNDTLVGFCDDSISFEEMTSDPDYLHDWLSSRGIAVYPRLARPLYRHRINQNKRTDFPNTECWSRADRETFVDICGPLMANLGYGGKRTPIRSVQRPKPMGMRDTVLGRKGPPWIMSRCDRLPKFGPALKPSKVTLKNCSLEAGCSQWWKPWSIIIDREKNAFAILGGSDWNVTRKGGWLNDIGSWVEGRLALEFPADGMISVFALLYSANGTALRHRRLANIFGSDQPIEKELSFRPDSAAARFDIALYFPKDKSPDLVRVRRLVIWRLRWA